MTDKTPGLVPAIRNRAEFYALRATIATLERMPWDAACAAGERLAELGYRPFGIRRGTV